MRSASKMIVLSDGPAVASVQLRGSEVLTFSYSSSPFNSCSPVIPLLTDFIGKAGVTLFKHRLMIPAFVFVCPLGMSPSKPVGHVNYR